MHNASLNDKCFESNKKMSFKISDSKLLKKYTHIWKQVRILLNKKLDSELVYGDNNKYIKAETKIYDGNRNTDFQGKENTKRKCIM